MLRYTVLKQNYINSLNKFNNETAQKSKEIVTKLEEKIKGTIVENWVKFWKNVLNDYRDVAVDLKKDIREKPLKAVCISSAICTIVYCAKHNPDATQFREAFVNSTNELLLVHTSSQNVETAQHLKNIEQFYNRQIIRRLNLGIASIVWIDNYSNSCDNYQSNCPYLQLQYIKFKERILDIGFLDNWWILNLKMKNYDINY